jgi:glycosyltransferase involved in cell wall biosynthesis
MDRIQQPKIYVVIPAFNEGKIIDEVISETKSAGYSNIIVVDDGSSDDTFSKADSAGAYSLRHLINRGKGAAIKTGIEASKIAEADIVVTMDGDGQHNPKDIRRMISLISEGNDVVLGTRMKNPKGMPHHRIIANHVGNFFTWLIFGLWVTDSQSGFRAYSKKAISVIETQTARYEYDSEVIWEIKKHKLKYIEVPIEVRYTQHSMSKKHRQGMKNGLKTLAKMIIS